MSNRMRSQAAQDSMKAFTTRRREKKKGTGHTKNKHSKSWWATTWMYNNETRRYMTETTEFCAQRDLLLALQKAHNLQRHGDEYHQTEAYLATA